MNVATLHKEMKKQLNEKEQQALRRAYDIVGNIAIVEIPEALKKKEKKIAEVLLTKKNIDTVVKKGKHTGVLRLQKTTYLAGKRKKETIAVENGISIKLHIDKVYYSGRQATERKRIEQQIKKKEEVLVMFSGAGPFGLEIAKHTPATVTGVELNKVGNDYAIQNALLNKVADKVKFLHGDVRKIVPNLTKRKKFDRIIMPLPKQAYTYLDIAFGAIKKNGVIHLYDEEHEEHIPEASKQKVKVAATQARKKVRILRTIKCGQLGVRKYRVCVDIKVLS